MGSPFSKNALQYIASVMCCVINSKQMAIFLTQCVWNHIDSMVWLSVVARSMSDVCLAPPPSHRHLPIKVDYTFKLLQTDTTCMFYLSILTHTPILSLYQNQQYESSFLINSFKLF